MAMVGPEGLLVEVRAHVQKGTFPSSGQPRVGGQGWQAGRTGLGMLQAQGALPCCVTPAATGNTTWVLGQQGHMGTSPTALASGALATAAGRALQGWGGLEVWSLAVWGIMNHQEGCGWRAGVQGGVQGRGAARGAARGAGRGAEQECWAGSQGRGAGRRAGQG